jgi:hypothetical protein
MLARYVVAIIFFYLDDDGNCAICLKGMHIFSPNWSFWPHRP